MWKGRLCSRATTNTISCGRKVDGAARIIGWLMLLRIQLPVHSSGSEPFCNRILQWLRAPAIILLYNFRAGINGILFITAGLWEKKARMKEWFVLIKWSL